MTAIHDALLLAERNLRRLDDAGVDVADLTLRRPTLDDVFLHLTGHAAEHEGQAADEEQAA